MNKIEDQVGSAAWETAPVWCRIAIVAMEQALKDCSGGGMMASEFTAAELATKIADLVFPHTSDQMQRRELEFLLTEFADAIRNERTEA